MKRINIVIGFTPFHAFFAERLIDRLEGVTYCIFTKNWPRSSTRYKMLGFFWKRNSILRGVSHLISYLYFSFLLRFVLHRIGSVHVYVPHPCNVFSNLAFFSNRVETVNIYEDGLLNYYDVDSARGKVTFSQRLLPFLSGTPFQYYSGHLAGYDARNVEVLYVSRSTQVVASKKVGKIVQLDANAQRIEVIKMRVLFLDQDVSCFISASRRRELISLMFKRYPPERYQYVYKGHHDYNASKFGMTELQRDLATLPAELIIPYLKPEFVISFFSSALLNIASNYSNVTCVSLAAGDVPITRDGVPGNFSEIFLHAGVCCV